MTSSRALLYGLAAVAAIAAHGVVVALLWHAPALPPAAPAVMVRLIERPPPASAPVAVMPPPVEVQPRPPAPVARPAPKPVAKPRPVPEPRPRPAAEAQAAPVAAPESQPAAPTPAAAPSPVAAVPPPEPELAVRCAHRPPPVYPAAARRLGQEGVVELLVALSATGAVTGVTVARSSGSSGLDRAALAAVRTWRCAPARVGGVAVPATAVQRIRFSLR